MEGPPRDWPRKQKYSTDLETDQPSSRRRPGEHPIARDEQVRRRRLPVWRKEARVLNRRRAQVAPGRSTPMGETPQYNTTKGDMGISSSKMRDCHVLRDRIASRSGPRGQLFIPPGSVQPPSAQTILLRSIPCVVSRILSVSTRPYV